MANKACKQNITIKNGEVYYFNFENKIEHQADFFCDSGYDMVGDDAVHCSDNDGRWHGNVPTCEGKTRDFMTLMHLYLMYYYQVKMCWFAYYGQ